MNVKLQTVKYIFFDFLASLITWIMFFLFRKKYFEYIESENLLHAYNLPSFFFGISIVPLFWVLLYFLFGYYQNVYRKSRLKELWQTFSITALGVIILFFTLLLDDTVYSYKNYYYSFFFLFASQFVLVYIPRLIITTRTVHKFHNRKLGFNTLLIGSNGKAFNLYNDFQKQKKSSGYKFVGYIDIQNKENEKFTNLLPYLGNIQNLPGIIDQHKIEEVILAFETSEHQFINQILPYLQTKDVYIKAIPGMHDIILGKAEIGALDDTPLIDLSYKLMPAWQENFKRIMDVFLSVIALIILSPLYLFAAIGVKLSSRGPVFYRQERIGKHGKPFKILKFRSMFVDAEREGPKLSSKSDSRITKFGLFMRKIRLDEIPQFYNVLIGEMSLVGPRPERQFFIDQIVQKAPYYLRLQKVKPGITSWGQVKFGYAENVEEMIERLKFDIIYLENMSIYTDIKILIYTILIILKRNGK